MALVTVVVRALCILRGCGLVGHRPVVGGRGRFLFLPLAFLVFFVVVKMAQSGSEAEAEAAGGER
jgi:hypothetical protein